jgi:hypothetical protein
MKITADNLLRIFGWIQIIGGITGLGLMAYLLLHTEAISGPILLIFIIGLSLFIFSIYTGKVLLYDSKRTGIVLTIINQAFQLFQWNILGYGLSYAAGAELLLGIKGLSLNFNISAVVSTFSMTINSSNGFSFSINIIALLIIIYSVKAYSNLNNTELIIETNDVTEEGGRDNDVKAAASAVVSD